MLENNLLHPCLLKKWVDLRFWPNLHKYIVGTWQELIRFWCGPFSKVDEVIECWKMAFLCFISWRGPKLRRCILWTLKRTDWILVTLTLFSRSQNIVKWLIYTLYPEGSMSFDQTCIRILFGNGHWLDFGELDPIFKVTRDHKMFKNCIYSL